MDHGSEGLGGVKGRDDGRRRKEESKKNTRRFQDSGDPILVPPACTFQHLQSAWHKAEKSWFNWFKNGRESVIQEQEGEQEMKTQRTEQGRKGW